MRHDNRFIYAVVTLVGLMASTAVMAADTPVSETGLDAVMRHFGFTRPSPPPAPASPSVSAAPSAPVITTTTTTPAAPASLSTPANESTDPNVAPGNDQLKPGLAEVLKDEPVLDAAAMAALARYNMRKMEADAARGLAGYDHDALPSRLRVSEAAVSALLRRLQATAAEPPREMPPAQLP